MHFIECSKVKRIVAKTFLYNFCLLFMVQFAYSSISKFETYCMLLSYAYNVHISVMLHLQILLSYVRYIRHLLSAVYSVFIFIDSYLIILYVYEYTNTCTMYVFILAGEMVVAVMWFTRYTILIEMYIVLCIVRQSTIFYVTYYGIGIYTIIQNPQIQCI